jgi:sec-independent protein translocase protein TatC
MSDDGKKLTFLGHLRELRKRLTRSVIAVVITTTISFIFYRWIFHILMLPAQDVQLVFIAMPYITLQAIMFVSPALTHREKKYVYMILPWITFMFLAGVVFGYFILIPPATTFLLTFGSDIATPMIKVGNYISIITRLLLAIGLVFEMPVVVTFLAKIGIVNSKWLASKRKIAIIAAFIGAAIITPTFDPINQSLVAVPLVILYEMCIWLAKLVQRKKAVSTT